MPEPHDVLMIPDTSRPLMSPLADVVPDLDGFATCPSCHTVDSRVTSLAVSAGADWLCGRCGQRWGSRRLETVAAYAAWLAEHTVAPTITDQLFVKADDALVVQLQGV
jgi:transcription elongation factor Elf1